MDFCVSMGCVETPMKMTVERRFLLLQTHLARKNPIETSFGDNRDSVMKFVEAALESDGVAMYLVVISSSLCS